MTGAGSYWRRGMKGEGKKPDSAESTGSEAGYESNATEMKQMQQELATLKQAFADLDKRTKDLNYVVYKLLYEMGGKELLDRVEARTD